jgi:hypothetical protein
MFSAARDLSLVVNILSLLLGLELLRLLDKAARPSFLGYRIN